MVGAPVISAKTLAERCAFLNFSENLRVGASRRSGQPMMLGVQEERMLYSEGSFHCMYCSPVSDRT